MGTVDGARDGESVGSGEGVKLWTPGASTIDGNGVGV